MKISILADNYAGTKTPAEHGLSYLIENKGKKILFDTGQSDLFMQNARGLDISLADIDAIVLSHGHFDHGNGLGNLTGGLLICHPGCFDLHYRKTDHSYVGLKYSREELADKFNLVTTSQPYHITGEVVFLGEIPRLTDFESKTTGFTYKDGTPDFVKDDSGIAILSEEGMFVVTGCGHAGIVNTIEYAKLVTGTDKVCGIIGGFHLKSENQQLRQTISYLRTNNLKYIFPSHCTELPALTCFYENFRIRMIRTGDCLNFPQ